MTIVNLKAQLDAVIQAKPTAHPVERGGRMTWVPVLDGCPEWLCGSMVTRPTESEAIEFAREKREFVITSLQNTIEERATTPPKSPGFSPYEGEMRDGRECDK